MMICNDMGFTLLVLVVFCLVVPNFASGAMVEKRNVHEMMETTTTLWCWVGSSNPKAASGYPSVRTNCSEAENTICQLTYVASTRVYEGSCVNKTVCEALYNATRADSEDLIYDAVACCNTSDCNGGFLANGAGVIFASSLSFLAVLSTILVLSI